MGLRTPPADRHSLVSVNADPGVPRVLDVVTEEFQRPVFRNLLDSGSLQKNLRTIPTMGAPVDVLISDLEHLLLTAASFERANNSVV